MKGHNSQFRALSSQLSDYLRKEIDDYNLKDMWFQWYGATKPTTLSNGTNLHCKLNPYNEKRKHLDLIDLFSQTQIEQPCTYTSVWVRNNNACATTVQRIVNILEEKRILFKTHLKFLISKMVE